MKAELTDLAGMIRPGLTHPSQTSEILRTVNQKIRSGTNVIRANIGEPDFSCAPHVIEAVCKAMRDGLTRYTDSSGMLCLREAVCAKLAKENDVDVCVDQVLITGGAKMGINAVLQATITPGDEVIVPAPQWNSHAEIPELFGGRVVRPITRLEDEWRLTPEQLDAQITPRSRWLLLCSPGNPTGGFYDSQQLADLGKVLERYPHVAILCDEIYERLVFDGCSHVSFWRTCPNLRDRTVLVNGFSKTYAMTGLRVGYVVLPKSLIGPVRTLLSQSLGSVAQPMQIAAVAALEGDQTHVVQRRDSLQQRRDALMDGLSSAWGVLWIRPRGALYLFVLCPDWIGRQPSNAERPFRHDVDVCSYVLDHLNIGSVPGTAFGLGPALRFSFGIPLEEIGCLASRIKKLSEELFEQGGPA